jgi:hypothetical protein
MRNQRQEIRGAAACDGREHAAVHRARDGADQRRVVDEAILEDGADGAAPYRSILLPDRRESFAQPRIRGRAGKSEGGNPRAGANPLA